MKTKVIVQPNDIILDSGDDTHFIRRQGGELVKYLNGWEYFQPTGNHPFGAYAEVVSPIFTDKDKFNEATDAAKQAINKLIEQLNLNNQSVSRIECWLEQSDDMDAVPHPVNGIRNQKYIDNQDYKNVNWVFEYIMSSAKMTNQYGTESAYGNRFNVETKKCEITKKYFVLKLKSSWGSI